MRSKSGLHTIADLLAWDPPRAHRTHLDAPLRTEELESGHFLGADAKADLRTEEREVGITNGPLLGIAEI